MRTIILTFTVADDEHKAGRTTKLRQDEIITAARRFRASGFHAASMSQIASEAGLSVGQIYRYFSNKDAIIEEMIRRIIDSRIEEMQAKPRLKGCRRRCGARRLTKMMTR